MKNLSLSLLLVLFSAFPVASWSLPDGIPSGAKYLGEGGTFYAYLYEGKVYKTLIDPSTVLRNQYVFLINDVAHQYPGLVPAVIPYGRYTIVQNYVDGSQYNSLSATQRAAADKLMKKIVDQVAHDMGIKWVGEPVPPGMLIPMSNGNFVGLDPWNRENWRFVNGTAVWFDPLEIASRDSANASPDDIFKTKSKLPIESYGPLKKSEVPSGPIGTAGVSNIKLFTFVNGAMAIAQAGLTVNDYDRAIRAATTPAAKEAVNDKFIKELLTGAAIGVASLVVMGLAVATLPATIVAGLSVALVGLSAVGLGSHISATFNDDIVDFMVDLNKAAPGTIASGTTAAAHTNRQVSDAFQLNILAAARSRPGYATTTAGTVTSQDVAMAAYMSDPSGYKNPAAGLAKTVSGAQLAAQEQKLFKLYADASQAAIATGVTPAQLKAISAKVVKEASVLNKSIAQLAKEAGTAPRFHTPMAQRAVRSFNHARVTAQAAGAGTGIPVAVPPRLFMVAPQAAFRTGTVTIGPMIGVDGTVIDPNTYVSVKFYDSDFNPIPDTFVQGEASGAGGIADWYTSEGEHSDAGGPYIGGPGEEDLAWPDLGPR